MTINGLGAFPGIQLAWDTVAAPGTSTLIGNVTLTGPGSSITISGDRAFTNVGRQGTGNVSILDQSTYSITTTNNFASFMNIGRSTGASGTVNVDNAQLSLNPGTGSELANIYVSKNANTTGELNVTNAGQVSVSGANGNVIIGQRPGSEGAVTVSGTNSLLSAGNQILIGRNFLFDDNNDTAPGTVLQSGGSGTLTVENDGRVQAQTIFIGKQILDPAENKGTLNVVDGGTVQADTVFIYRDGTLAGNGTVEADIENLGGTVEPGLSPGDLNIIGNVQDTGGTYNMEVIGNPGGTFSFDRVLVDGFASIVDAILNISFAGLLPGPGDVFNFFSVTDPTNSVFDFAQINLSGARGDFETGLVNNNFVFVAQSEFESVPEPTTLVLMGIGLAGLGFARRRRNP